MPTKTNSNGEQQKYIPAGNGDKSGEFTNDKSVDQIKSELGYKEEIRKDNSELVDKVDISNPEELNNTLESYYNWLVNESIEHSIIIDKGGNVWHTKGDEASVYPSPKIDMDGAIDIHNHIEPHSFSKDDLNYMKDKMNTLFKLVDKDFIYSVKFLKELDIPYNSLYRYGITEAEKVGDMNKAEDFYMEYLKDKGYISYEKFNRHS